MLRQVLGRPAAVWRGAGTMAMRRLAAPSTGRMAAACRAQTMALSTAAAGTQAQRILISDALDPSCAAILRQRGHEVVVREELAAAADGGEEVKSKEWLLREIENYDGLVVRSATKVTEDVLEAGTRLKVVGRAGTGVDNIDVAAATRQGVLVVNTPGGNTVSTAELTMSHILALARNVPNAVASVKAGEWTRSKFTGTELTGKTLGIVGVGRIGRVVASWCNGFGMDVIGYDPLVSSDVARVDNINIVTLEELFRRADFITVHTPLTKDTKHLLNDETLAMCKQGVRIINCARGGIVDEEALVRGLESGQVGGAALDVFETEPPTDGSSAAVIQHPGVNVSPHIGASTSDAQLRVAKNIAHQMSDIFEGGDFVGVVNAPNMNLARQRPMLLPFIKLAERIGAMHAQLLGKHKVRRILVNLSGEDVADSAFSEPVMSAVLRGTLSQLLTQDVNYVNAKALADDIGLTTQIRTSATSAADSPYANTMTVGFEIEGNLNARRTIGGTVFGGGVLRIYNIDGFDIDMPPADNVVIFNNDDVPGVLMDISNVLAKAKVNIGHFSLGRHNPGEVAMGALVLDEHPDDSVIDELRNIKSLHNVMCIKLEDREDSVFRIAQEDVPSAAPGGAAVTGAGDASDLATLDKATGARYTHALMSTQKPTVRPASPNFGSGPCKKRPGYSLMGLDTQTLGRSHRSKLGKGRLAQAIADSKRILGVPDDYVLGIVPASDTGAFEMAMWSMLGKRNVDVCYWESFGKGWYTDCEQHLRIGQDGGNDSVQLRKLAAEDYGQIPDLSQTDPDHDILFTWNGTTSGVRVPNADWISEMRTGLTFNDATSAAFAMPIEWPKVDVTTFSWQKVLGGEGAHGVIVLSPRAVERLESYTPPRPLPKIFRMVKKGKLDSSIFDGSTINTPSMLCVEDYLDALRWADTIGGAKGLYDRCARNFAVMEQFVAKNEWVRFLASDPAVRSPTSVCLILDLSADQIKDMCALLEAEGVAYDINAYRDAPAGLRIWCGSTVDAEDLETLCPWLEWAYEVVASE